MNPVEKGTESKRKGFDLLAQLPRLRGGIAGALASLFPPESRRRAFIGAGLFGLGVSLLLVENLTLRGQVENKEELVEVVVAKKNLSPGVRILKEHVEVRLLPKNYLHPKAVLGEDLKRILGRVLREGVDGGAPILWGDLAPESRGESRLSRMVRPGERAVAFPVDEIQSLGYQILPGDRVDLFIVTRRGTALTVMPILQSVTVLGVGDSFATDENPGPYGRITLSLTPREAEMILLAREVGKLYLLLRNENDVEGEVEFPVLDEYEFLGGNVRKEVQEKRNKRNEEIIRIIKGQG
jgi:pilus assembly protein CpaB